MKRSWAAAVVLLVLLLMARPAAASVEGFAWPHRAGHWPTVYVENHASNARWHVLRAVHRWGSGLRYGHCRPGAGCVRVWGRDKGPNHGYLGTTYMHAVDGKFVSVGIYLNRYYAERDRPSTLRQASKHELGHAMGLGHDPYGGVMAPVDNGGARITAYERGELARIYGVRR